MTARIYTDRWLDIWQGDAKFTLEQLATASVDCVVTSPPYYGLRDYGTPGQLGLEDSPEAYVDAIVEVARELRRVLKPTGSLWLNLGDSYAAHAGQRKATDAAGPKQQSVRGSTALGSRSPSGIKPKDLIGIPWMVAFALRADGWWLRRDVIWDKPNGMPESVTDRPTSSHEYMFLLTPSADYFYDSHGQREPFRSSPSDLRKMAEGKDRIGGKHVVSDDRKLAANSASRIGNKRGVGDGRAAAAALIAGMMAGQAESNGQGGRNMRSVWTIATRPYPGAHYAVFPEELPTRAILLTSSAKGVCPECGAPWWRRVDADDWAPGCGCGWGGQPDDLQLLASPQRRGVDDGREYRTTTGRRGLDRPRLDGEGTWLVTRHEQRQIAAQLRAWDAGRRLEAITELEAYLSLEADEDDDQPGRTTWEHYVRTDAAGARVPPLELVERWVDRGWMTAPEPPDTSAAPAPIPATILDPFAGSGTVGQVANRHNRRAILIDLNADYLRQQMKRNAQTPLGLEV